MTPVKTFWLQIVSLDVQEQVRPISLKAICHVIVAMLSTW